MARTKGDPKGRKRPLMTEDELKCFVRSYVYEREVRGLDARTGVTATPQPPPGPPPTIKPIQEAGAGEYPYCFDMKKIGFGRYRNEAYWAMTAKDAQWCATIIIGQGGCPSEQLYRQYLKDRNFPTVKCSRIYK